MQMFMILGKKKKGSTTLGVMSLTASCFCARKAYVKIEK